MYGASVICLFIVTTFFFIHSQTSPVRSKAGPIWKKFKSSPSHSLTEFIEVSRQFSTSGKNVSVGIFDTGIVQSHTCFTGSNIVFYKDYTSEKDELDHVGHGTFVASVIACQNICPGLSKNVELYIFKVFNKNQHSETSWFLEAFDDAIKFDVDLINLSIGGTDTLDMPFLRKVNEVVSNGITIVAAGGNDGPIHGSITNPADMFVTIGVSALGTNHRAMNFSSGGPVLDNKGTVLFKPDISVIGSNILGASHSQQSHCKKMSGTSTAAPIITSALALAVSLLRSLDKPVNPSVLRQLLYRSAKPSSNVSIVRQGIGELNLYQMLHDVNAFMPSITVHPPFIDWTDCPFLWPICAQPMFYTQMPVSFNLTILNSMSVESFFEKPPSFHTLIDGHQSLILVSFGYESGRVWPHSSMLNVIFSVSKEGEHFSGEVTGVIRLKFRNVSGMVSVPIRLSIIARPPRHRRILWDTYHSIQYPPGYMPRDDLKPNAKPLDAFHDHVYTNFKTLFESLVRDGFYVDVLFDSLICFDASSYQTLVICDPERPFTSSEIGKLEQDIATRDLSMIVIPEWFNSSVQSLLRSFDHSSKQFWTPLTGGSNLPSLNEMLHPLWGVTLSDIVIDGAFSDATKTKLSKIHSGVGIAAWNRNEVVHILTSRFSDQGRGLLSRKPPPPLPHVPYFLLSQKRGTNSRLAVLPDSSCLEDSFLDCLWLFHAALLFTAQKSISPNLPYSANVDFTVPSWLTVPKFPSEVTEASPHSCSIISWQHLPRKMSATLSQTEVAFLEKAFEDLRISRQHRRILASEDEMNRDGSLREPSFLVSVILFPFRVFFDILLVLLVFLGVIFFFFVVKKCRDCIVTPRTVKWFRRMIRRLSKKIIKSSSAVVRFCFMQELGTVRR